MDDTTKGESVSDGLDITCSGPRFQNKHAVWKYELPLDAGPLYRVRMPYGSGIVAFQIQHGVPTIWADVNPLETETEERILRIVGTGHVEVAPLSMYRGTVQIGPFVWHLFEEFTRDA